MNIAFRLDASVAIGSGHLMRCLALADTLKAAGATAIFAMRCDIQALQDLVQSHGHHCILLPAAGRDAPDPQADALQTVTGLQGIGFLDWLAVDHYGLDARWEKLMRPHAERIMAIDDLADRPHDCDLLLDQNLHVGMEARYRGLVPEGCVQLLGPQYAILRPEFAEARLGLRVRDGAVRRVAIFFGATDPAGATASTLGALAGLPTGALDGLAWDVVVGAANPRREEIELLCGARTDMDFHCQIGNMAQVMAAADLCIGAGGTALWERATLGVPSIVTAIADNQVSPSAAMARAGALLYLGEYAAVGPEQVRRAVLFACGNPWLLSSLARRGMEMVDGQGARRIAHLIAGQG